MNSWRNSAIHLQHLLTYSYPNKKFRECQAGVQKPFVQDSNRFIKDYHLWPVHLTENGSLYMAWRPFRDVTMQPVSRVQYKTTENWVDTV